MTKNDRSKYYADENAVRLIAAQVIIIASLALWQGWLFPFFFLSADFALRSFTHVPSPLAAIARVLVSSARLKPRRIFAAPKKFAAGIGSVFSLAIFVLLYLNYFAVAWAVGGVLIFCAFLESVLRICIGCYVYDWLIASVVSKRNHTA